MPSLVKGARRLRHRERSLTNQAGSKAAQLPLDQLTHVVTTFGDAILDVLSVEVNHDFVATLLSTWNDCFDELPSAFGPAHISHLLQTCESILQQVAVREKTRQGLNKEHVSADDELDLEDAEVADAAVLQALSRTLRLVIGLQKEGFDLRPFRGQFEAWIQDDPSVSTSARRWALRIAGALVQTWGPASVQVVGPAAGNIVLGIRSKGAVPIRSRRSSLTRAADLEVRFSSAFVVGCCAASASSAYVQVINGPPLPCRAGLELTGRQHLYPPCSRALPAATDPTRPVWRERIVSPLVRPLSV